MLLGFFKASGHANTFYTKFKTSVIAVCLTIQKCFFLYWHFLMFESIYKPKGVFETYG